MTPVAPIGEFVIYQGIGEKGAEEGEADAQDREGVYLGGAGNENEVLIGTPEGVVRAQTFRRRAAAKKWSRQAARDMTETSRQPDLRRPRPRILGRRIRPARPGREPMREELSKRRDKMENGRYMHLIECTLETSLQQQVCK